MLDTKHKSSYIIGMNKLPIAKRVQILSMLCEGSSMRSVSRVGDVSINTVTKLLVDMGRFCAGLSRCKRARREIKASPGR